MIVPTLAEVTAGYRDTRFLLRLRWRMVRSTRNRVALFLGFGIFALVIYGAINTGTVVRNLASEGIGTAAGVYAVNYVIALDRGELGLIGATALGAALLAALFAPFTGGSVTALFPEDDLTGFRPARMHRYFDSLITTAISSIGFLQLIALTTVGSLLTIGGGRAEGILLVWAIWPILVFVTVAEEWLVELVHRSFGASMRRLIFGLLIFGVALAIMLDPNNGRTIFGLGDQFLAAIEAAADRNFTRVAVTLVVVAALCALLFLLGLIACRSALAKPAAVASTAQTRATIAEYKELEANLPSALGYAKTIEEKFPTTAEQPDLYTMVRQAALDAGIAEANITDLTPGVPALLTLAAAGPTGLDPNAAPDPTAAQGAPTDPTADPAAAPPVAAPAPTAPMATMDVAVSVSGTKEQMTEFVENLEQMNRAYLISNIGQTSDEDGSFTLTVSGTMFMLPALVDPREAAAAPVTPGTEPGATPVTEPVTQP